MLTLSSGNLEMASETYHHGNLRDALLDAVNDIIREDGIAAVGLREAARRVGVSHSAPAHHFGDKTGLMTAYAARGFDLFGDLMRRAADDAAPGGPHDQLRAIGLTYLRFSVEQRPLFEAMFRPEFCDPDDPVLRESSHRAFGVLLEAVERLDRADLGGAEPLHAAMASWATVHGLATLWHDGLIAQFTDEDLPSIAAGVFELDQRRTAPPD
jgi:AcrR family transcriptional regulator